MGIKHVNGTTTSLNGCKVEIDGDVIYTLIPLHILGFRGVVRITGNSSCPSGDLFFDPERKCQVALSEPADKHKHQ